MRKEAAVEYFVIQPEYVYRNVVESEEICHDSRSACGNQTSSFRLRREVSTTECSLVV
jgi:hypothetical protein